MGGLGSVGLTRMENLKNFAQGKLPLLLLIVCVFVLSAFILFSVSPDQRKERTAELKTEFSQVQSQNATDTLNLEDLQALFAERKSDYDTALSRLTVNHQFTAVFLVLGLMILIYRPKNIRVPLVGTDIPESLVYVFTLFGTIYLWSNLGLLLISTIDSRLVLENLSDLIDQEMGGVSYYYSGSRTLLDQGFVDTWTTYYFDIFKDSPSYDCKEHRKTAGFMLFTVYAPMYGTALAASLGISFRAVREKFSVLVWLALAFNLLMLIGGTVQILHRINYANDFFAWVWLSCGGALTLWFFFGEKLYKVHENEDRNTTS